MPPPTIIVCRTPACDIFDAGGYWVGKRVVVDSGEEGVNGVKENVEGRGGGSRGVIFGGEGCYEGG